MNKTLFLSLLLICISSELFAEKIQILSVVKKDKVISNAEVILQKSGKTSKMTHSKSNGQAIFKDFGDSEESDEKRI